ncbi:hypothetical protein EOPP23_01605 [Endozoicomonas sp. OPT23]|uniref:twin-arginine translocation signal domain-containing protein n=1 Tax=Endozoicomonas sp. OPT23 TaxID=2072845 RepID=UPI00129C06B4|nr:twin-arginine translocation signal domain-containing protein [Endozoicomonas sp. OPT23]MRI31690.1 hypothetical protein [Endozoicomonas sp. OPT23]
MHRRHFIKLAGMAGAASAISLPLRASAEAVLANSSTGSKPSTTVWLPENGQSHEIGKRSPSPNIHYIKNWQPKLFDGAGSLLKTDSATLPAGRYVATFQIWHDESDGDYLGDIKAWQGSHLVSREQIIAEDFPDGLDGGYQRCQLEFTVSRESSDIRFEVWFADNGRITTGAVSVTPVDDLRPFYNIGHRCSTMEKADEMVSRGANMIEFDITPELVDGRIEFNVKHSGDLKWTRYPDFNRYLANLKKHMDQGNIAMIMLDTKQDDAIEPRLYALDLAERLIKVGITPEQAVMSVPAAVAGVFRTTLGQHGKVTALYGCGIDAYLEDYGDLTEQQWVEQVEATGASFLGVGAASQYFWSPMKDWMSWIQALANRRDQKGAFGKAYFWTINKRSSIRKCLDYNVDGIITDEPDRVRDILKEPEYQRIYRLADERDSQFKVHGYQ